MSARDAATRADSSDSIAASAATVSAGSARVVSSCGSMYGMLGAGSEFGSSPITDSGVGSTSASSVTTMMPISDPGMLWWISGSRYMQAATITTAPIAQSR